jgi:NAD+ diphosphatase
MLNEMEYCPVCGAKLEPKYLASEGKEIPYCPHCDTFRFQRYNTAVSMIVMDEAKEHVVLIKQYGRDAYILVAGYVNPGEDAEDACKRELKEELGMIAESVSFNHSHFFVPSNTLMLNFTVTVKDLKPKPNEEIDTWTVFTRDEAVKQIRHPSLAEDFLDSYFHQKWAFPSDPHWVKNHF